MRITSSVSCSVFFSKPPQKAFGISHHNHLSKQPREKLLKHGTLSFSASYPGKSFEHKLSSILQHATLRQLPTQAIQSSSVRHYQQSSSLEQDITQWVGSIWQCISRIRSATVLSEARISQDTSLLWESNAQLHMLPYILWTCCQGHASHSYDDASTVRIRQPREEEEN